MSAPDAFVFGTVGLPPGMPPKPGGSIGAVEFLSSIGLRAFEIGWVRSVRVTEDTCLAIRQAAAAAEVAVSVHAPYYINLNADADEWPRSRQRLMDAAHFGNLAGATDIVFHPGSYFGQPPEAVLGIAIERLRGCVHELRAGQNPVRLRPETMGKTAMLGSLRDVLRMSAAIDGVEPCIDVSHLHARPGDGSMNDLQAWSQVLAEYREALGSTSLTRLHIHCSGIEYGPKGERRHLPLTESDFDLRALMLSLSDAGCGGRILCESPEEFLRRDALLMKQAWESISAG